MELTLKNIKKLNIKMMNTDYDTFKDILSKAVGYVTDDYAIEKYKLFKEGTSFFNYLDDEVGEIIFQELITRI